MKNFALKALEFIADNPEHTKAINELFVLATSVSEICVGCGHLQGDPFKTSATACCPDSEYVPLRDYISRSRIFNPEEVLTRKTKADKWDTLGSLIEGEYASVNSEGECKEHLDGHNLFSIGELAATAFGYLESARVTLPPVNPNRVVKSVEGLD